MRDASDPRQPLVIPEGFGFKQAQERVLALEGLFNAHGVPFKPGTQLEQIALNVFDAMYQRESLAPDNTADVRVTLKHLIGLNELAGMILLVRDHPEFPKLIPLLGLLNEGAGIQNMPSPVKDQATNKVFELFACILALQCGSNLEIDDDKAQGKNPDVLITIAGKRWGMACKAVHSSHPEAFISHLEKGIDQIEKSPAETGVVFFAIKNLIDQEKYWSVINPQEVSEGADPLFSAFVDPRRPFDMLIEDANVISKALADYLPEGHLQQAFANKKCQPGFMVWAHVATSVVFDNLPIPTSARVMAWQYVDSDTPTDLAVLNCLHDAAYAADFS